MSARADRMLIAVDEALRPAFPSHAYGYGYLQGAIKTALIRLEYGQDAAAIRTLTLALELSERPHQPDPADA